MQSICAAVVFALLLSSASATVECELCKHGLELAQKALKGEMSRDAVIGIGTDYCKTFKGGFGYSCDGDFQCHNLCGIVASWAPTVFASIESVDETHAMCKRYGLCGDGLNGATDVSNDDGAASDARLGSAGSESVPVLQHASPSKALPIAKTELISGSACKLAHVSDIHTNPFYKAGGWTDCGMPSCCYDWPYSGAGHQNANTTCGTWGDYIADAAPALMESWGKDVATLHANPSVGPFRAVLFTGDLPPHNVWNQSREWNTAVIIAESRRMALALPKGLAVLPLLGNHAGFPVSSFRILNTTLDVPGAYGPISAAWRALGWLNTTHEADFVKYAGAYVADIPHTPGKTRADEPFLRIITLNSNLFVSGNLWALAPRTDAVDPGNQQAYTEAALANAASAGAKVFIAFHHPVSNWHPVRQDWFRNLTTKYDKTILALLNGHTHRDETHVTWDTAAKAPVFMEYEPGSITPLNGRNPGWRYYTLGYSAASPEDVVVSDFTNRRANLANLHWIHNVSSAPLLWSDAYTCSVDYGMPDVTPNSWLLMVKRASNDSTLFEKLWSNYNTGNAASAPPKAGSKDWYKYLCGIIGATDEAKDQWCSKFLGKKP